MISDDDTVLLEITYFNYQTEYVGPLSRGEAELIVLEIVCTGYYEGREVEKVKVVFMSREES